MGNSLRCCIACVLPCGAFDLARVVHINGHVKEVAGGVTAGEILAANPGYVLSRPSLQAAPPRRITLVSPESELKKGGIYFLIPEASLTRRSCGRRRKVVVGGEAAAATAAGRRRSGGRRIEGWRPHLGSIVEDV